MTRVFAGLKARRYGGLLYGEAIGVREGGEVIGDDVTPRRVGVRLAPEEQRPPRAVQRDDDLAPALLDAGDLAPGDADVQGAVELQPQGRQLEVADLVGLAPAEADGGGEVTLVVNTEGGGPCLNGRRRLSCTVLELATHDGLPPGYGPDGQDCCRSCGYHA